MSLFLDNLFFRFNEWFTRQKPLVVTLDKVNPSNLREDA